MKQKKPVTRRAKASKRTSKRIARIEAKAARRRPKALPDELAGLYKPVKKPVTLRLDADILAWFQRDGRGYQTRINIALRQVMTKERG
jgi:uncharacterized protein (DUF4415 family)